MMLKWVKLCVSCMRSIYQGHKEVPDERKEQSMKIPTKLTKPQFERYIEPSLSKAKRGYVSKVPLYKIFNSILYKLSNQWC